MSIPQKLGYSPAEAAKIIGTSRPHLYSEHKRGKLIFRKSGNRTLILHDDLMAYIGSLPVLERSSVTDNQAA